METTACIVPIRARFASRSMVGRLRAGLLAIAAAIAVLLPVARANAQGDVEEMAIVFNPLTPRSVEAAKRTLSLDEDQAQVAKDLYSGYRSAIRTLMKETQAKSNAVMEKAREEQNYDAIRKGQMAAFKEAFEKVEGMEKSFNDDLKAVLTEEQVAKFPSFERARRRENARLIQFMAGEGADVVDILAALKIDTSANEEIKALLTEYEVSFDRAISERQTLLKEFIQKMIDADGSDEMQSMMDFMPKLYAKAKAGRDVNRQAARRIGEILPEADRARFALEVNRRSFPSIYKVTATGKKLEAAAKFEDLSETQKGQVEATLTSYRNLVEIHNKEWSSQVDAMQEDFGGDFKKMMSGEEPKGVQATEEARKKRVDLEKSFLEKLEQLLSAEQKDRLPVARPDDEIAHVSMMEPDIDHDAIKDWKEGEE
jgi:hypothetical protein